MPLWMTGEPDAAVKERTAASALSRAIAELNLGDQNQKNECICSR